jgi:hypothetical protein
MERQMARKASTALTMMRAVTKVLRPWEAAEEGGGG